MIQMRSILDVADNSGARKISIINPIGGSTGRYARLGDIITASVKEATPESQVKKGSVVKAVIALALGCGSGTVTHRLAGGRFSAGFLQAGVWASICGRVRRGAPFNEGGKAGPWLKRRSSATAA